MRNPLTPDVQSSEYTSPLKVGTGAVRSDVVRTHAGMEMLEGTWRRLQRAEQPAGVFATWQWNHPAARHFVKDSRLLLVVARRDGAPVAIAPLAYRRIGGLRALSFIGSGLRNYALADYGDFLLEHRGDAAALDGIVDELDRQDWDMIWLQEVPPSSILRTDLSRLAQAHGWSWTEAGGGDCYQTPLPASWQEYEGTISRSTASHIARKTRRLTRDLNAGVRMATGNEARQSMEILVDLHRRRWQREGQSGIFAAAGAREFYTDVAVSMAEEDMLALLIVEGRCGPIAASLSFDFQGARFGYTSGYLADDDFRRYSPGLLLDAFDMQDAISKGQQRMDFLRGEGHYKSSYGVTRHDNADLLVFRNDLVRRRFEAYRRMRSVARTVLRRGK